MNRSIVLSCCALALSGCYTTTISNGKPQAAAAIAYDERWHHGLVWGLGEFSGPYDLQQVCPNGWAEIKTEVSFANGIASAVTSGIYSPQTITVRCAKTTVAPPAAAPPASAPPASAPPASAPPASAPPTVGPAAAPPRAP